MSRKLSMLKSMVVTAALVAGVSGIARADDSSMDPATGDSYAYFNGGNIGHITNPPVFAKGPSPWRQSHPNGLTEAQFAALGSGQIAARLAPPFVSTAAADPTWRLTHPNGLSEDEFAALGSEAIAARQSLPVHSKTTAFASTNPAVVARSPAQ
jgi:hypothetical protein